MVTEATIAISHFTIVRIKMLAPHIGHLMARDRWNAMISKL